MDTNNNSNSKTEPQSDGEQDEQSQQPSQQQQPQPSNKQPECLSDQKAERIELYVKYEQTDLLDQESGTQTPIEDEPRGSDETDNSHNDRDTTSSSSAPTATTTTSTTSPTATLTINDNTSTSNLNNNNNNDSKLLTRALVVRVRESEEENSESIELELEDDNSLLLTSLTSLFPDATGLKYRHSETNTLRGVKLADGKFIEPLDGWSSVKSYICVFNRVNKRKNDEDEDTSKKLSRIDMEKPMGENGSDLVVLGLPWTTTEDTMSNYFEQYGEVVMVQVKTDPKTGKSRGFGFVRFAKSSIQSKLLSMRHFIDGRWCDVRVPLSKAEADATKAAQLSRKIFVGRLPDNITTDDLRNHFSEYGTLTDVFIPKPFRNFAFVTFGTSDMAQSIFKHKHIIKGAPIQISEAIPRDNAPNSYGGGFSSGGGGASSGPQTNAGGYNGGYGSAPGGNIHPFNNSYGAHQASHHYHSKNAIGGNFGGQMYQNSRKMHPSQSTYYQTPSYGSSGPSGSVDSASYVNHSAHSDYGSFVGATSGYSQPSSNVNGGQYYKMQQQPVMAQNQNHSTYPNQSSYSSHGANFSRGSYGSVWK